MAQILGLGATSLAENKMQVEGDGEVVQKDSTRQPLAEFTLFPKLATELRLAIWHAALDALPPCTVYTKLLRPTERPEIWTASSSSSPAALASTNQEAREVTQKIYSQLISQPWLGMKGAKIPIYFNPSKDNMLPLLFDPRDHFNIPNNMDAHVRQIAIDVWLMANLRFIASFNRERPKDISTLLKWLPALETLILVVKNMRGGKRLKQPPTHRTGEMSMLPDLDENDNDIVR